MNYIMKKYKENETTVFYLISIFLFFAIFVWLIIKIRNDIHGPDEAFFLAIARRMEKGEALILQEWSPAQLVVFVMYLPVKIFCAINGSTEGIILFSRCFFLCCHTLFAIFLFFRLRKYYFWGLGATLIYYLFIPEDYPVINYYTLSTALLIIILIFFFLDKKITRIKCFVAGFLFAVSVLLEPLLSVCYFVYSVITVIITIRKKSYDDLKVFSMRIKVWHSFTYGIMVAACFFFIYIICSGTFTDVLYSLSHIFNNVEYPVGQGFEGILQVLDISRLSALRYYGISLLIAAVIMLIIAVIKKDRFTGRPVAIGIFCFLIAAMYIYAAYNLYNSDYGNEISQLRNVPVCLLGLWFCISLKDRKLTNFLIAGFVYSIAVDLVSDCAMGYGAAISIIPSMIAFSKAASGAGTKIRGNYSAKKRTASLLTACVILCVIFSTSIINTFGKTRFCWDYADTKNTYSSVAVIDRGPLKGIATSKSYYNNYEEILNDIDCIEKGKTVYFANLMPMAYLYYDSYCPACSVWFCPQDLTGNQADYWNYYKEKRPDYIYISNSDKFDLSLLEAYDLYEDFDTRLSHISQLCEFEITHLQAGDLLTVKKWLI